MKTKILNVRSYEQSTFLTCLSACFMIARDYLGEKVSFNQDTELEIYNNALRSVKDFYQFGFLADAIKKGYKANMILEVPGLFEYLRSLNKRVDNRISFRFRHISIDLIKEVLKKRKGPHHNVS